MTDRAFFVLAHAEARRRAVANIQAAPDGYTVTVKPPNRSLDQNAKFHALCSDIAKHGFVWGGRERNAEEVKVLLVSAYSFATKVPMEIVRGIEGEPVSLRESTASMARHRMSGLIEYAEAFAAEAGIHTKESA